MKTATHPRRRIIASGVRWRIKKATATVRRNPTRAWKARTQRSRRPSVRRLRAFSDHPCPRSRRPDDEVGPMLSGWGCWPGRRALRSWPPCAGTPVAQRRPESRVGTPAHPCRLEGSREEDSCQPWNGIVSKGFRLRLRANPENSPKTDNSQMAPMLLRHRRASATLPRVQTLIQSPGLNGWTARDGRSATEPGGSGRRLT